MASLLCQIPGCQGKSHPLVSLPGGQLACASCGFVDEHATFQTSLVGTSNIFGDVLDEDESQSRSESSAALWSKCDSANEREYRVSVVFLI